MVKVIEFPESVMYGGDRELATVNIGEFTGNREIDKKLAIEILEKRGINEIDGYIFHHDYKNGVFQLIDEKIHIQFSHYGGYYFYK